MPARDGIAAGDPVLLADIISPNSHAETRGNIWAYATLPSLREILVVHSTRIEVELFRRDAAGNWPEQPRVSNEGDTFQLASIDLALPVRALYRTTSLAPA